MGLSALLSIVVEAIDALDSPYDSFDPISRR